jgi:hypothetical protein
MWQDQRMAYLDPLICRGRLAIIEARLLRAEHRQLREKRWVARELLRQQIFHSASQNAEIRCVREEMARRRSGSSSRDPSLAD